MIRFAKCSILRTFLTHESWFLVLPFWCHWFLFANVTSLPWTMQVTQVWERHGSFHKWQACHLFPKQSACHDFNHKQNVKWIQNKKLLRRACWNLALGKEWERVQWQMFPQVCETPIIAYHFTPYEGGSKCWFTLWSKDQRTISPRTRSWTPLLYPNLGIRFLKFEEIIINELMKNAAL